MGLVSEAAESVSIGESDRASPIFAPVASWCFPTPCGLGSHVLLIDGDFYHRTVAVGGVSYVVKVVVEHFIDIWRNLLYVVAVVPKTLFWVA